VWVYVLCMCNPANRLPKSNRLMICYVMLCYMEAPGNMDDGVNCLHSEMCF